MAKYSFEMKIEIVKAYLNNEGGYTYLANKYGIPDKRPVQLWVAAYKAFGEEGLMRSRKNETYTFEFKLHVVELYLSKQQFHYHKKRISETKDSISTVFHGLKISDEKETSKKATAQSEVKIIIGNATVAIPVSETTLITSIIKELAI